jgi:uroporphyrinogen-III synthase
MTHVLVTRPYDASQQLADQLDALGLIPIVMPLYTFAAREPVFDFKSVWSEKPLRKLAVFTSPRAVEFGLPYISPHDQLHGLEIAVVGSATRVMLETSGYPVHLQARSGFTSEDLLQVPGLAEEPGTAVIFCAPGGRDTIAKGLRDFGWRTIKAMVYERVPLQPGSRQVDHLRDAAGLISIWTSISALKLAKQYLPQDVWGKILQSPALVISSRIQHHLKQLGASDVDLADGPGNPELLRSILRLTGHRANG